VSTIRTVIIDDEAPSRGMLRESVERDPRFTVVAEASGGREAIELVRELTPDAIFLDISMPEVDGFDVALALGDVETTIVFVTAHDRFALRAFEVEAIDYVLKPIDPNRFQTTLDRLAQHAIVGAANALHRSLARPEPGILKIKAVGAFLRLAFAEILYIEARGNYVELHALLDGDSRSWLVRVTFNEMLERLQPGGFTQIHRSFAVNPIHIKEVRRSTRGRRTVHLTGGAEAPVGRSYRVLERTANATSDVTGER
jgi:two-component system LytT family response regulator